MMKGRILEVPKPLGSHTSYGSLKTVAGMTGVVGKRIIVKWRAELGRCRGSIVVQRQ